MPRGSWQQNEVEAIQIAIHQMRLKIQSQESLQKRRTRTRKLALVPTRETRSSPFPQVQASLGQSNLGLVLGWYIQVQLVLASTFLGLCWTRNDIHDFSESGNRHDSPGHLLFPPSSLSPPFLSGSPPLLFFLLLFSSSFHQSILISPRISLLEPSSQQTLQP